MLCLHIGSSSQITITSMDTPIDTMITLQPMNIVQCAADLVWSPMFSKFPNLKVALSEGGIGWIPYFLERIDYVYNHHHPWTNQDFGGKLPSQVFNENVLTCFIDDAVGMEVRHHLNMDIDHVGVRLPALRLHLAELGRDGHEVSRRHPDDEINKITHLNAMNHFKFDPFKHIPKEQCTVGALGRKRPTSTPRPSRTGPACSRRTAASSPRSH